MKQGVTWKTSIVFFAAIVTLPIIALAFDIRAAEKLEVKNGERISNDAYLAGGEVTSRGEITGDLVAAAGTLTINGPVWMDLLAAGGTLTLAGDVGDDARVAGGKVDVLGYVRSDLMMAGGELLLSGKGVGGDAAIAGGSVKIEAPIAGSARIAGAEVFINAPITGNVQVKAEKLTLGPKALLSGNLSYSSTEKMTVQDGAVVKGNVEFKQYSHDAMNRSLDAAFSLWMIAKLLMILVGALALFYFFPRFAHELSRASQAYPMPSLGTGIVFLIVTPVVSVALMITLIGMPLGIFGLVAYIGSLIFSCIATPIVIGGYLHKWIWKKGQDVTYQTLFLGVIAYFILGLIPILGPIAKFVFFLISLGAVLGIKWSVVKQWR